MVAERIVPREASEPRLASSHSDEAPQPFRWTTEEFHRLGETGIFEGRRVELIEGEIYQMSPMLSRHAAAVMLADEAMRATFGQEFRVRMQLPFDIGRPTDPEPDIAVVHGTARDFANAHPTTAALIIEISDSTLRYDRTDKANLYASAGIEDLWILNLQVGQLEVMRVPREDTKAPSGWSYAEKRVLSAGNSIAPLAAPQRAVGVADLLP